MSSGVAADRGEKTITQETTINVESLADRFARYIKGEDPPPPPRGSAIRTRA
jgi:hypothetical protein